MFHGTASSEKGICLNSTFLPSLIGFKSVVDIGVSYIFILTIDISTFLQINMVSCSFFVRVRT